MDKVARTPVGPYPALDFFAGSGLVRLGLTAGFETVWANDICPKKAAVYSANFPSDHFLLADIRDIHGKDLPLAQLAWASFPCQDLSLAGNLSGLGRETRSGLFWQWVRVLEEMHAHGNFPSVLCAENVVGFLSTAQGAHFKAAYAALRKLGYVAGAVVVDACRFLPQSRPRAFLICVSKDTPLSGLIQSGPSPLFHPKSVIAAANAVDDPAWTWWALPAPQSQVRAFSDLYDKDAPCDPEAKTKALLNLLSARNHAKLDTAIRSKLTLVGTGYKRTRPDADGVHRQRFELRFDGIAGCLRTPEGGSSRQVVIVVENGRVRSRLMTERECARLMGVEDCFALPGTYNDAYRAMGDAVAVPVTRFLSEHLLSPLVSRQRTASAA